MAIDYRKLEAPPVPSWVGSVFEAFGNLLALEPNWDGEHGRPVAPSLVGNALRFIDRLLRVNSRLPAPSIVPIPDGGLQIEWHRKNRDLEIEFSPDGSIGYYYYDSNTGVEQDGPVTPDLSTLQQLIEQLL